MRHLFYIFCVIFLLASVSNQAEAQSLMQTAKKAEQRAKELKQQESSRYNAILDSKDLTKYNQYIADYPKGKNTPEIKRRAEEIRLWNNANSSNSITAYEIYLSKTAYHWFDSDAKKFITSIRQEQEKKAWKTVKAKGTILAFQQYLRDNPNSGYRQDAEIAINRLQGAEAWTNIKNSSNISDLEGFIVKYPQAQEVTYAKTRLHELKGKQHYDNRDLASAYNEFSQINLNDVSYSNRTAYDAVMEYHEFSTLGQYSTESSLQAFMKKYPNSSYSTQISNMIAVAKARNFGDYASNYDYNQALSYAKDAYTRNIVQSYITMNKKNQKDRKNALKSWKRKQNGGTVNLGLDFMDLGLNGAYEDCKSWYYNVGLMLRFGNYRDRIQFAIGLKPGILGYNEEVYYGDYYYDYYDTETKTAFHMPIVGQLKLNLFKTSENSRFFIYGQYQYNAVRFEEIESEMSWGAGLGIAWKHFDWSFYYRQDIGCSKSWDYDEQKYFGMSLIYYWQL